MLKRVLMVLAAGVLTIPLAACDFTANGTIRCHDQADGKVICEGDGTYTPSTVPVPPTTPPPTTTPVPPPTTTPTTPQPTTPAPPPPTTTQPPVQTALTAAERYGWGSPVPTASDEFTYTGKPDTAKWELPGECWPGHDGNGKRCASNSAVANGVLTQTGEANGDSAWLASRYDTQYGRWEARVRSVATGANNGRQYHPLLIVWPSSDRWPDDGEYDFLENGAPGETCAEAFIHYPHPDGPVQQVNPNETNCGAPLSEWHNIAYEWTPDHVKGFVDGKEWFSYSGGAGPGGRKAIQAMPSGHLTIQLDNFYGSNMQPAKYEIDWVRTYKI